MIYFDIALNLPLEGTFIYRHCLDSQEDQNLSARELDDKYFGMRAEVRFGNRKITGFITKTHQGLPEDNRVPVEKIRPIEKLYEESPLLTRELLNLANWMAGYYIASLGECIFAMIPHSAKRETSAQSFSMDDDPESWTKRELSQEQKDCVEGILDSSSNSLFHYLYGPTGSGKTEVFLSAAEKVLENGKGVIYLVPEIGLTPQVTQAVVKRFGSTVAVLHSGLTPSQKLKEWRRILNREARVVIGARSGIFAPVPDLGLIIIDEEHDGSYKSGSSPRYHARQTAMMRSVSLKIPLVMGSATPSVEAWKSMADGKIVRHNLTKRLAGGAMPEIRAINLSQESSSSGAISKELQDMIRKTCDEGRQTILFLNRRGFSHFFRCNSCGWDLKCKNCSVSMTYHKSEKRLRCHYCGWISAPPQQCPECGSYDIGYSGFGTEFIEADVKSKFPNARIVRVDTDSIRNKDELTEKIESFKKGEFDIMLGTQMVAKGLNFPKLKLVGVISADTGLHLPDFRAAERTFSLITQVAGRAGRFFPDGKVLVQSYSPDREPIARAVTGEIDEFYRNELLQREILNFPPYVRIVRIVIRSMIPNMAENAAADAANILRSKKGSGIDIMGPTVCPLEKIGGNFRQQIILRGRNIKDLITLARTLTNYRASSKFYIEYDVDPVDLL